MKINKLFIFFSAQQVRDAIARMLYPLGGRILTDLEKDKTACELSNFVWSLLNDDVTIFLGFGGPWLQYVLRNCNTGL